MPPDPVPQTNLRQLTPSRKRPKAGDIFVLSPAENQYLFGRVILAVGESAMPASVLVYLYDRVASTPDVPSDLTLDHLLLPPLFTNLWAWRTGVFETIAHAELRPGDVASQHCFCRGDGTVCVDEQGERLPARVEPCGEWSMFYYHYIDDLVSDALGIPRWKARSGGQP